MAKTQSALDKIKALREQINGLELSDDMKSSILDQARAEFSDAAGESLFKDMTSLANHDKHAGAREFLAGQKATFSIVYPEDPSAEPVLKQTIRKYTPRTAAAGGGARGKTTVVTDNEGNESTYDSASAACDALGFDHEGKSAVRVLQRAEKNNQIKAVSFVDAPSSDDDDDSDD